MSIKSSRKKAALNHGIKFPDPPYIGFEWINPNNGRLYSYCTARVLGIINIPRWIDVELQKELYGRDY